MKIHTYSALQIFPSNAQLATFEKVCMAYQHIFARLFAEVYQANLQGHTVDLDYNAMLRKLRHEDELFGTNVFSKYEDLVKGAVLKVKSIFMPVLSHLDVRALTIYLERERTAGSFALPMERRNGKLWVPYIGELSVEGRYKNALFVEFVRSRHAYRNWHAKAISETTINPALPDVSGIVSMTPVRENPVLMYSTGNKAINFDGMKEYSRFIELKATSAGSALKRMRECGELFNHDYNQGKRDYENRMFELERRAMEYAPDFARQIFHNFANVGFCYPTTPGQQINWDYLGLDILMVEVERIMLLAAVDRKQLKSPVLKFHDMAHCPMCRNSSTSRIDGTDVVCGKRNHDRLSIFDAVANNTLYELKNKL